MLACWKTSVNSSFYNEDFFFFCVRPVLVKRTCYVSLLWENNSEGSSHLLKIVH